MSVTSVTPPQNRWSRVVVEKYGMERVEYPAAAASIKDGMLCIAEKDGNVIIYSPQGFSRVLIYPRPQ